MDATVKQLNIKVVDEGLDETIAKVKLLGEEMYNLSSKKTTKSISTSETKQEAKATKETSKNLKSTSRSLSKILISLISIRKLSNFFKDAFEESSSWIENLNLFEVALDDCTEQGLEFTKTMSDAFGLDQNQLIEYMGLFNQMATAIGNSTEIAYKMSEALTALGLDISSLYNISVESAMSKLRSGIAGQVKPVRELGLDITAQSLDKYLKEDLGLDMTSKALSQSQKQLLRTIMLIQQTNNAWGDLSKTINTFSNQQKILLAQTTQLKRAFGDLFIGTVEEAGIATKALYYINGALMAMVEIIRTFIPQATSSGFNKVEEDIDHTTEGIEEMEEQLNKSLFSFDKFNSLNSDNSKGDDWLSELLEKGFLDEYNDYMNKFNSSMDGIQNKATKIKEQILEWLGYSKDINGEWTLLDNSKMKVIQDLFSTIGRFIKEVFPPLIKLAGDILPMIAEVLEWILPILSQIIFYIADFVSALKEADAPTQTFFITLGALIFAVTSKFAILKLTVLGLLAVFKNWSNMSGWQKVISIVGLLTTAIFGLAIATGTLQSTLSWGIAIGGIVAGIAAVVGSIKSAQANINEYANGGYPDTGQLFIANEAGAELVGNIGGRTAVANNDMIVQAIENASYRGMAKAMGNGANNNLSISFKDVNANDLSRALATSMIKEFQRQGYKVSKA